MFKFAPSRESGNVNRNGVSVIFSFSLQIHFTKTFVPCLIWGERGERRIYDVFAYATIAITNRASLSEAQSYYHYVVQCHKLTSTCLLSVMKYNRAACSVLLSNHNGRERSLECSLLKCPVFMWVYVGGGVFVEGLGCFFFLEDHVQACEIMLTHIMITVCTPAKATLPRMVFDFLSKDMFLI